MQETNDLPLAPRLQRDRHVVLSERESTMLVVPWGPFVDVIVDPKGAPGATGGRVRLVARVRDAEVELATATFPSDTSPVTLRGAFGCSNYAVLGQLGSRQIAFQATQVESYVCATVYAAR